VPDGATRIEHVRVTFDSLVPMGDITLRHYVAKYRVPLLGVLIALVIGLAIDQARAEPQTRFYDSQGRSVGTATPYGSGSGSGSVRYYDAQGKTLGTSTTTGNTTRFYDAGGRPTGSATSPGSLAFPRR
jgi:YD repeat-containing protein